jgi:two-component system, chemotaxis family, protein-glutamate methylesterase/glutaminase
VTPSSNAGAQPSTDNVVTVLVVDDSPGQRRFLTNALNDDPGFRVVGEATNGGEAVAMVERLRPATVLMDLDLPVMNGIEAIERIMAGRPTPIVVYSSFVDGADNANAVAATAAGAVDIYPKPAAGEAVVVERYVVELRRRLRVASRARVITHPRGRLKQSMLAPANGKNGQNGASPQSNGATPKRVEGSTRARAPKPVQPTQPLGADELVREFEALTTPIGLVAIGASTGGPQALAQLLAELPENFVPAVLVVQHMADGFIEGLAGWLDGLTPLPVHVGESGRRLLPGTVTVAPSGLNLIVHDRKLRVTCERPPTSQYHVPGIDATFKSVAHNVGAESIGVLLTGMGRDGAAGLKLMRDRGAVTIAQDEATSAVYGMPQAARALGAVEHELPLEAVAPALVALLAEQVAPDEVGA